MAKLVVSGYIGSGSSAITDLLSEYSNVHCPNGSYEYVFLHCPNGVFDLEDKLLRGNNALRSDEALRSFRQAMAELNGNGRWWFADYEHKIGPQFMKAVDNFIDRLTTARFKGFWYETEKESRVEYLKKKMKLKRGAIKSDLYDTDLAMAFPTADEFYAAARLFIQEALSHMLNDEGDRALLLDQLFLPHNLHRIGNYFDADDIKSFVISRDPRDVFIMNKYVWPAQNVPGAMPTDADLFCTYYDRMRKAEVLTSGDITMRVRFEDLVVDYDNAVSSIEQFCGDWLGEHVKPLKNFNPAISRKNIAIFAANPKYAEEVKCIEERLGEYLYPGLGTEILGTADSSLSDSF